MSELRLAILGCGDFLRCERDSLTNSKNVRCVSFYDPDTSRAKHYAQELGGQAVDSPEAIFTDNQIDAVALFVPPWVRKDLFSQAAKAGKHILCTKPLAPTSEDCQTMMNAAKTSGIKAGVIYSRTEDAFMESFKELLDDGRFGRLALYRQDWIHAHPKWNNWATDPEKNGGPFMDAMIHNLNAACYLMDRPIKNKTFFSDRLAHPQLACADTEAMIVHYTGGGVANLFITWAADLATYNTDGNNREHIDLFYLVTDQGWRLTRVYRKDGAYIIASREGEEQAIPVKPIERTHYDAFAAHIEGDAFPRTLADLDAASRDISLIRSGMAETAAV